MKRIALIDGNSLINRAYYAMRNPMITKDGIYTHGIFGFINMMDKIRKDYEPEYMAIAFDLKTSVIISFLSAFAILKTLTTVSGS